MFQINPNLNLIEWKSYFNNSKDNQATIKGSIIHKSGQIIEIPVDLIIFSFQKELYSIYIPKLAEKNTQLKPNPNDINKNIETNQPYNYDDLSHNSIFYCQKDGHLIYKKYNASHTSSNSIKAEILDDLFLETDGGSLLEILNQTFEKGNLNVSVQLVLKQGKSSFVKGYGRCSAHQILKKEIYRIEFIDEVSTRLYGNAIKNSFEDVVNLLDGVSKEQLTNEIISETSSFTEIITKSEKYKNILAQVAQVADTNTTVLITGETGTGKELLASAIHKLSDRSDKILIKVNCASIPAELIESTLFGHEKGSFTGADKQKLGKFEIANGGTIFLDEIGELPINLQAKLLRALQEQEIERVGNALPIKIDVRVIAATNRDLDKMIQDGTFRSDLYYRLNVFPIHNIPLRERPEDVEPLINHFIQKFNKKLGKEIKGISKKDLIQLKRYNYPGNIRELENIIERATILSKSEVLDVMFFNPKTALNSNTIEVMTFDEMLKSHIIQALQKTNGKVTGSNSASELLDINGKTLASKLRKYDINPKNYI